VDYKEETFEGERERDKRGEQLPFLAARYTPPACLPDQLFQTLASRGSNKATVEQSRLEIEMSRRVDLARGSF